MFHLSLA